MIILCMNPSSRSGTFSKQIHCMNFNFILLRASCSYLHCRICDWPCKQFRFEVHSQQSLPVNNHFLRRAVKTFAITKWVSGNAFCFRYFNFVYYVFIFTTFFFPNWNVIGTVTKFVLKVCVVIPTSPIVTIK